MPGRSTGALVLALLVFGVTSLFSCSTGGSDPPQYVFTEDWFSWNEPVWTSTFAPYKGKPNLRYLEVGVYEGRSALWMMDNILTHPSSRATFIDIKIYDNLTANIKKSGRAGAIEVLQGRSQTEMRRLPLDSYDIIYIDGSHTADDVLADAIQSWELLKVGGLLIFDDYDWESILRRSREHVAELLTPRPAIDAFLKLYAYELELLHKGYQVIVRKRENPCAFTWNDCSPFGPYVYLWEQRNLNQPGTLDQPIEITGAERELIETFLESESGEAAVRGDPAFAVLNQRLELGL